MVAVSTTQWQSFAASTWRVANDFSDSDVRQELLQITREEAYCEFEMINGAPEGSSAVGTASVTIEKN